MIIFLMASAVAMLVVGALNAALNEVLNLVDATSNKFTFIFSAIWRRGAVGFSFGTFAELGSTYIEVGTIMCVLGVALWCTIACQRGLYAAASRVNTDHVYDEMTSLLCSYFCFDDTKSLMLQLSNFGRMH